MINKLEKLRKDKKISQEEMARVIDISLSHYRNIEKNRAIPTVVIALEIARILHCKVENIFILDH